MTHVFISPHPDDAALSCGGLIASLRELGQSVTIISVFSGRTRGRYAADGVPAHCAGLWQQGALATDRGLRPQRRASRLPGRGQRRRQRPVGRRPRPYRGDPGAREHPGAPVLAAGGMDAGRQRDECPDSRAPARRLGGRTGHPGRHRPRQRGRGCHPARRGRPVRVVHGDLTGRPGPAGRGVSRLRG